MHPLDDLPMFRTTMVRQLMRYDEELDVEKLHSSLLLLFERPEWHRIGARTRKSVSLAVDTAVGVLIRTVDRRFGAAHTGLFRREETARHLHQYAALAEHHGSSACVTAATAKYESNDIRRRSKIRGFDARPGDCQEVLRVS